MVTEDVYFQMMKNCSNWNNRNETERQKRYPVIDAQTGTAQRPSPIAYRTLADRYPASSPTQYCTYISKRWKRKKNSHPSSDAIEMKYIVHCNPAINDVLNQAASAPPIEYPVSVEPVQSQVDTPQNEKRNSKAAYVPAKEGNFDTEVEDPSEEDTMEASDEDDWSDGKRKRRRKNPVEGPRRGRKPGSSSAGGTASNAASNSALTVNTQAASSTPPADSKPFGCQLCAARYKSRAGLNYHCANVHPDSSSPNGTPQQPLMSPNIEISTFCDICLGDCNENKKTLKPEQLVSCHDCGRSGHPTCLGFRENMITSIKKYGWQCLECKSCAICGFSDNDDQLLFCDDCDRGFHLYCLKPRLSKAPEGEWSCHLCQKEFGSNASLPAGQ